MATPKRLPRPPASRVEAMVAAIRKRPSDDDLRLVYADALEEAGDLPRAELIRIQIALARAPTDELRAREQAHLAAHEAKLAPEHAETWRFDRGLVTAIGTAAPTWIEHGKAMFEAAPITTIGIDDPDDDDWDPEAIAVRLAKQPWLRHVTAIEIGLYRAFGEAEVLGSLLRSRHLAKLADLAVTHPSTLRAAACLLPRLTGVLVYCEGAPGGDAALEALARHHRRIARLQIVGCGVSVGGVKAIAAAKWPLRYLVLGGTHYQADAIGEVGMRALVKAPALVGLEQLGLEGAGIDDAALRVLAGSKLRALEQLNLSDSDAITDAGLAALAGSPVLSSIRELDLGTTGTTTAGREALRRSPFARADLQVVERGSLCCWFG